MAGERPKPMATQKVLLTTPLRRPTMAIANLFNEIMRVLPKREARPPRTGRHWYIPGSMARDVTPRKAFTWPGQGPRPAWTYRGARRNSAIRRIEPPEGRRA